MKTLLLAAAVLALSFTAGNADSALPTHFGLAPLSTNAATTTANNSVPAVPKLSIAPLPGAASSTIPSSASEFAQLGSEHPSLPVSSGMVLALVALFVIALRILGLNHARTMADHERDSHHGKAEMFRHLHAQRAGR